MNASPPHALIFDVFGTVVDWRSGVAAVAGQFFGQKRIGLDPYDFADAWRGEYQPTMERVRSGGRGYVPLDDLHRENLDIVLERFALADRFSEEERSAFNAAWEKLPPWPDAVAGLARLRRRFIVAPCSNGSIALMTRLSKFAGLPWDAILGADIAHNYKPRAEVYRASCAALRLDPSQVMMVAAHPDDLDAAMACGLRTAFIPRPLEHGAAQQGDPQADHHAGLRRRADFELVCDDIENLAETLTT